MDSEYKLKCLIDFLNDGHEFHNFGHLKEIKFYEDVKEDLLVVSPNFDIAYFSKVKMLSEEQKHVFIVNGPFFDINYSLEERKFFYEQIFIDHQIFMDLNPNNISKLYEI
ncbi:hypothetical protein KY321_04830 [Candidatus Woesearchaeota archaeon]|nr:hypothetical protein [Candidatus Woesearchaeota archaeon]